MPPDMRAAQRHTAPGDRPPDEPGGDAAAGGHRADSGRAVRILVVDDHEANRYAVARLLRRQGFEIREAVNGREALEAARQLPDLVVLDINMPGMNGWEVCRRLKSDPLTQAIPVLHLSATFRGPEHRTRSLLGGGDAFLTHPVEPSELLATVTALLRVRAAERALRGSVAEWRATFDALRDALVLVDRTRTVVRANLAFGALVGRPPAGTEGMPLGALFPPLGGLALDSPDGGFPEAEVQWGERDYRVRVEPVRSPGECGAVAVVVLTDISREKRDLLALARSEQELNDLFEHAPIGIHWVTPEGVILRANRAELALLGYPREEYLGRHVAEFHVDPAVAHGILAWVERADEPPDTEAELRCRDGSLRRVVISSSVRRESGRPLYLRCFSRDVTALRRAEAERRLHAAALERRVAERTAELQESYAQLETFSYSIAHDLRAPIRAIHGYTEAILEEVGELARPELREWAARIREATWRMDMLIRDLLAFSRLSRCELRLEAVDLRTAVMEGLRQVQGLVAAAGAEVGVLVGERIPPVQGDCRTLAEVVAALLANAVKFVAPGVRPRVEVGAALRPGGWVRLWVADNGIGIEPRYHERI
ncbi:MAG TPA: response regulator, partial [Gemmatimonadales bacterium]|nr:response regulator [Gemmatimonadales bacterium]